MLGRPTFIVWPGLNSFKMKSLFSLVFLLCISVGEVVFAYNHRFNNNNNNNIRFLERISKLYALTIKSNVMNKIMTSKAKNSF